MRCQKRILIIKSILQHDLPLMKQKKDINQDEIECETYKDFWTVEDMFTFENIGFSHQVGTTKYVRSHL